MVIGGFELELGDMTVVMFIDWKFDYIRMKIEAFFPKKNSPSSKLKKPTRHLRSQKQPTRHPRSSKNEAHSPSLICHVILSYFIRGQSRQS